jgi:hypothetical protein
MNGNPFVGPVTECRNPSLSGVQRGGPDVGIPAGSTTGGRR